MYLYRTAYINFIKINFVFYDYFCVLENSFQLFNPCLDVPLLVLRRIIFRVLRQVSLLSRLFDLAGDFLSLYYLQVLQLIFQGLQSCISK